MLSLLPVRSSFLLLFLVTSGSILSARPNIALLVADDLGYAELGCQGNTDIPTPHIDSIAERGARFTDAYVTAPFCSASRAGFITGRYQTRFGYEFNPTGAHNEDPDAGLPVGERTLGDQLTNAGYTTALIGKWHLGGTARYHPQRRGFDTFYGFLHEGHYFVPPPYRGVTTMLRRRTLPNGMSKGRWISKDGSTVYTAHMGNNEPDYDANNPILRSGQPVEETQYLTDALTREAVSFIGDHKDRPFFLYLSYNAVHSPLQGAERYMKKFAHIGDVHRRIFAAMLANLDDSIGAPAHCATLTARVLRNGGLPLKHVSAWYSPTTLYLEAEERAASVVIESGSEKGSGVDEELAQATDALLRGPLETATVTTIGDEMCSKIIENLVERVVGAIQSGDAVSQRLSQQQLANAVLRCGLLRGE